MPISITYWRDVLRKLTTTEMDNNFENLANAIENAGLSPTMPEGQIYIGDNTNTASLETLDTSIVPETIDKNYQTDNQKLYNDATSSIQTQLDNRVPYTGANSNVELDTYSLNAKSLHVKGTGGAGHLGLKHQSSNITASASESSIGADISGNPVWKNDGNTLDYLQLKSEKDVNTGYVGRDSSGGLSIVDATITSTTASTLAFISSAKKIISATGALLGTWFQTLTADTNPVDADTIVVNDSVNSFEAKKTTLLQLWTNYLLGKVQALGYLVGSGLTTNNTLKWNGSQIVNSNIVDTGTLLTYNSSANSSKITNNVASNQADITLSSSNNTIRAFTYAGIQNTAITMTNSGVTIDSIIGGFARLKSANDGRQVYVDNTMNYYANTTHQFVNQAGTNVASITVNGLALGSATINARSQLHLQSTSKGFLPNVLTTAQRDAVSWVAGDAGMIIYNSTTNKHQGWNGTTWNDMY